MYHGLAHHHIDEDIHHLQLAIGIAGGAKETGAAPLTIPIAGDILFRFWHSCNFFFSPSSYM